MLVIKVNINYTPIDEIWIHNKGEVEDGICEYGIELPKGDYDRIFHKRDNGYEELLMKALEEIIIKKGVKDADKN